MRKEMDKCWEMVMALKSTVLKKEVREHTDTFPETISPRKIQEKYKIPDLKKIKTSMFVFQGFEVSNPIFDQEGKK